MTKQINKIIEYGLYLLVFLMPFQTRWIIRQGVMAGWPYEFGTLSLYATDILLVLLIVLNAWARINSLSVQLSAESRVTQTLPQPGQNSGVRISLAWWLIGGIELMTFISMFVAIDKAVALQAYLRLLLGIGLFWLVVSTKYDKQKLVNVFIASAAAQAILGVYQFLVQATFASKFLGMARHLPMDIGDSVITATNGVRWLRAYGSLDHPNIFGGLMAIALLMMLIKKGVSQSEEAHSKTSLDSVFYYIIIFILTCGLFFSFSRAAWIGFGGGSLAFILFFFTRRRASACSPSRETFVKGGGAAVVVFILLACIFHNLISARALNGTWTENKSINDRLSAYKVDAEILKSNWFLGVGVGNYGLAVQNKFAGLSYNDYQPMHNVYLLIYSEIGIIGFVCFCSLFIYFMYVAWKTGDIGNMTVIMSILIMFLFDHWWWSLHFGLLFLFLIYGMSFKRTNSLHD
jgi:O-antigen ligase